MSEFKNCPFCGRLIANDATSCKHCGKELITNNAINNVQNNINMTSTTVAQTETFKPSDAFSYMFTDKTFISKAIIVYAIVVISVMLLSGLQVATQAKVTPTPMNTICFIIGMLINSITVGYIFSCTKTITNQNNSYSLPSINLSENFIAGIKFWAASFIMGGAFALILVPIIAAIVFLPMVLKIIIGIIGVFFLCKYIWVSISFYWIYAHKNYLTIFFKYKLGKAVIANSKGSYGKGVLYLFLYGILSGIAYFILAFIGGFLFKGSTIMASALAGLSSTYFMFVFAYIYSKMINPECVTMLK